MNIITFTDHKTRQPLGHLTLVGGVLEYSSPGIENMCRVKLSQGQSPQQVFDFYADQWTNGYVDADPTPGQIGKRDWTPDRYYHNWVPRVVTDISQLHPDYQPGQWQTMDRETSIRKYLDDFLRTTPPDFVARYYPTPQAQRAYAEQIIPGGVVVNGPHRITIATPAPVSDSAMAELTRTLDQLMTRYPVRASIPYHTKLSIVPDNEIHPYLGQSINRTPYITLSDAVFDGSVDRAFYTIASNKMPAFTKTPPTRYILAHEWGHTISLVHPDQMADAYETVRAGKVTGMSEYGLEDMQEAFAEAFAEWFITEGKTRNPAARYYALKFGW